MGEDSGSDSSRRVIGELSECVARVCRYRYLIAVLRAVRSVVEVYDV